MEIGLRVFVIISSLLKPPPLSFKDKLCDVIHIINACNYHMQRFFVPYFIPLFYNIMSMWITCPGFLFFPHDPHPKGSKYYTICCSKSVIMYGWDIVEVEGHPITMGVS